jgi:hypothetical protein
MFTEHCMPHGLRIDAGLAGAELALVMKVAHWPPAQHTGTETFHISVVLHNLMPAGMMRGLQELSWRLLLKHTHWPPVQQILSAPLASLKCRQTQLIACHVKQGLALVRNTTTAASCCVFTWEACHDAAKLDLPLLAQAGCICGAKCAVINLLQKMCMLSVCAT